MTVIISTLRDRVRETTSTVGFGAFVLNGAISGYRSFSSQMANGDTTWYACVLPGGAWEVGVGTWVTGNTLQRTSIIDSSNGGTVVNFGAGTKDIFIALPASKGIALNNSFPSGTLMLFQQTNAPVYWTKQVSHNDKALRVVSGAAGSGGSATFSGTFNSTIGVANTTITISTMPSHNHLYTRLVGALRNDGTSALTVNTAQQTDATQNTGGDGAHSHTLNMNLQYVDLIIASKD